MDKLGAQCSSLRSAMMPQRTNNMAIYSRIRHRKRAVQRLNVTCTAIEPDLDIPSTSGRPPVSSSSRHINGLPEMLQDMVHDMVAGEHPQPVQQPEEVTLRQLMNRKVKGAETILNLLTLIEEEGQDFDFVNTAHALHRLAKLWRSYSSIHAHTQQHAYQQLVLPAVQLLSRHMEQHMSFFEPWDVAISIWAYGLLGYRDGVVLPLLLQRAAELSPMFRPPDCTQVLIGLARLGLREEALLKELAYVIMNQLEDVRAQDLSQVIYCYGKLRYDPGRLFLDSVVDMAMCRFRDFKPMELVNMLYGFAHLGYRHSTFVLQASKSLHTRRRSLAPQDISNLLWSLAQLKTKYNFILDELPAAIIPCLRQFKPCEVSGVVWSYFCFRHYHRPLFNAIEAAYRGRLAVFNTQELVVMMRAYSLFSMPISKLRDGERGRGGASRGSSGSGGGAASRGSKAAAGPAPASRGTAAGSSDALSSTAAAGAAPAGEVPRQQTASPEFQQELAAVLQGRSGSMTPQAISLTAKAITHWGLQHEGLQAALSAAALQRASDFNLVELAHMMWAISRWSACEQPLVAALLRQAHWLMRNRRISSVRSAKHMLDSIVSSCQRMGFVPWALIDDAESMSIYLRSPTQELLSTWGSESMMGYSYDSDDEAGPGPSASNMGSSSSSSIGSSSSSNIPGNSTGSSSSSSLEDAQLGALDESIVPGSSGSGWDSQSRGLGAAGLHVHSMDTTDVEITLQDEVGIIGPRSDQGSNTSSTLPAT